MAQCNTSFNVKKGTLRGVHFKRRPHEEAKVVRCTSGAIYDVVLDLRSVSPTFKKWIWGDVTAANRHMLYIPEGCAHGFLTLEDDTEVFYQMSEIYQSGVSARCTLERFGIPDRMAGERSESDLRTRPEVSGLRMTECIEGILATFDDRDLRKAARNCTVLSQTVPDLPEHYGKRSPADAVPDRPRIPLVDLGSSQAGPGFLIGPCQRSGIFVMLT